jgi:uncharacterized integral membrane protein
MVESGNGKRDGRKLSGGAIASLGGLAVLVIFIVQNTEDVRFDFLWLHFTWPLWLYTIIVALFGAIVWFGLGVMRRHERRKERRADR